MTAFISISSQESAYFLATHIEVNRRQMKS